MKNFFRGRILPILTVVCIIAVTVAIAVTSVSAEDSSRLYNWQGYITTELLINARGSDRSNPLDNGDYLTLSETELYVGDSICTNGQWMNYDLNYTKEDGTAATGKIGSTSSWYYDGEQMFYSQLYYGKINGTSNNNAVKFTKAGTWTCTSSMTAGGTVTLITFEVAPLDEEPTIASSSEPSSETSSDTPSGSTSDTSSDSIDFGHEDTTVEYKCRTIKMYTKGGIIDDYKTSTSAPSNLVEFDTYCVNIGGVSYAAFCVGDSLKNICWWRDYNFTSGSSTGKITNAYLKCAATGLDMQMQVGYGHTTGGSDNAYVFEKPGEYRLVTGDLGGEKEIAKFYVFWPTQDIADQIFVASGAIDHGQEDPSVKYTPRTINMSAIGGDLEAYKTDKTKPSNLVNFDTDYITVDGAEFAAFCVGDGIVNTNAWRNFYFQFESDGVLQPCTVDTVYLYCDDPSYYAPMNVGYGYTCGSTNAPIRFLQAGEYYMVAVAGGARYEIARFHVFWPTQDIVNQLSGETEQTEYNCDVNSDGVVDSRDLIVLQMRILGLLNN